LVSVNLGSLNKLDLRRNPLQIEDQLLLTDSDKFKKLDSLRF
jgi:hypothetical protein